MKQPKCKICEGAHYTSSCFQAVRKPIKRTPIKRPTYEEIRQKAIEASTRAVEKRTYTLLSSRPRAVRRSAVKPQSNNQRKLLTSQLDHVFSVYVRKSASIRGYVRCVTCGDIQPWKDMHNGHYISRKKLPTRWSLINCHPQCPKCNLELKGNIARYKNYLIQKYGLATVEELHQLSNTSNKVTVFDIQKMIAEYTQLVKELPS